MKKLLLTVAVCAASVSSFAQSLMWEYNPKTKSLSNLVAQPVGTLNSVPALGKIDVSLVGGVQYENGALTRGSGKAHDFSRGMRATQRKTSTTKQDIYSRQAYNILCLVGSMG